MHREAGGEPPAAAWRPAACFIVLPGLLNILDVCSPGRPAVRLGPKSATEQLYDEADFGHQMRGLARAHARRGSAAERRVEQFLAIVLREPLDAGPECGDAPADDDRRTGASSRRRSSSSELDGDVARHHPESVDVLISCAWLWRYMEGAPGEDPAALTRVRWSAQHEHQLQNFRLGNPGEVPRADARRFDAPRRVSLAQGASAAPPAVTMGVSLKPRNLLLNFVSGRAALVRDLDAAELRRERDAESPPPSPSAAGPEDSRASDDDEPAESAAALCHDVDVIELIVSLAAALHARADGEALHTLVSHARLRAWSWADGTMTFDELTLALAMLNVDAAVPHVRGLYEALGGGGGASARLAALDELLMAYWLRVAQIRRRDTHRGERSGSAAELREAADFAADVAADSGLGDMYASAASDVAALGLRAAAHFMAAAAAGGGKDDVVVQRRQEIDKAAFYNRLARGGRRAAAVSRENALGNRIKAEYVLHRRRRLADAYLAARDAFLEGHCDADVASALRRALQRERELATAHRRAEGRVAVTTSAARERLERLAVNTARATSRKLARRRALKLQGAQMAAAAAPDPATTAAPSAVQETEPTFVEAPPLPPSKPAAAPRARKLLRLAGSDAAALPAAPKAARARTAPARAPAPDLRTEMTKLNDLVPPALPRPLGPQTLLSSFEPRPLARTKAARKAKAKRVKKTASAPQLV
ncbi:hypothetical protein M885DRAFT_517120 [Pelagophyceae sp. CCMP2097]|nr:hypothetical protein M885DRAFT_517120 [Pelagophyceae sp. CCMP2097]